jgi:hypothetical protein
MKRKCLLLFCLVAAIQWGCKKGNSGGETPGTTTDEAALTVVKIEAKNNTGKVTADVTCTIAGDSITALIPDMVALRKFALTFTPKTAGTVVKVGDTIQTSGTTVTDFTKVVNYVLTSPKGVTKTYKVILREFTGLPIIYLTTATGADVKSKEVYINGNIIVDANNGFKQDVTNIPLQVKGRGNSTWSLFPKKPYRLKFSSKAAMLGMPAAKNWGLLANYNDKTLMRNKIAFDLGKRIGADYTPQSRFVEVVLNGQYWGNYLLTSLVEIHENRVNITELKATDTSPAAITGGYIVELDYKLDADYFWRSTTKNLPFTIKEPEDITTDQFAYIKNYMQAAEDALYAPNWNDAENGYAKYIDADSFMRWYVVNETMKNQDTWDFSSIFYYKDRGGKLGMGPIWDFDISSGNCETPISIVPTGWYSRYGTWMIRLAQDQAWNLRWRNKWKAWRLKEVQQIFTDIDNNAAYLKLSADANFRKWPILDKYVFPNAVYLGTYDKEVAYFKNYLTQRIAWMDANIGLY